MREMGILCSGVGSRRVELVTCGCWKDDPSVRPENAMSPGKIEGSTALLIDTIGGPPRQRLVCERPGVLEIMVSVIPFSV